MDVGYKLAEFLILAEAKILRVTQQKKTSWMDLDNRRHLLANSCLSRQQY